MNFLSFEIENPENDKSRKHYYRRCKNRKKVIFQSNIYRNFPKVEQVAYTLDTICILVKYHDPSSSDYPDILLTVFHRFTIRKFEKGHNSVKNSQNFETT